MEYAINYTRGSSDDRPKCSQAIDRSSGPRSFYGNGPGPCDNWLQTDCILRKEAVIRTNRTKLNDTLDIMVAVSMYGRIKKSAEY